MTFIKIAFSWFLYCNGPYTFRFKLMLELGNNDILVVDIPSPYRFLKWDNLNDTAGAIFNTCDDTRCFRNVISVWIRGPKSYFTASPISLNCVDDKCNVYIVKLLFIHKKMQYTDFMVTSVLCTMLKTNKSHCCSWQFFGLYIPYTPMPLVLVFSHCNVNDNFYWLLFYGKQRIIPANDSTPTRFCNGTHST